MPVPPRIDPASFRDPLGRVFLADDNIYRIISPQGRAWLAEVWECGIVSRLTDAGLLIGTRRVEDPQIARDLPDADAVALLEHERLAFVSYPYEWPFTALKKAALLHLDLHLALLSEGFTLSDGTAFNVQFRGTRPVYIDVLSIAPYREGQPFAGYAQFQRQFLNPLVLEAESGFAPNAAWRGSLDGISSEDTWRLLPLRAKLKPANWTHVGLTARYDRRLARSAAKETPDAPRLPKSRLIALLRHLRIIIARLQRQSTQGSAWSAYHGSCSYTPEETAAKMSLIGRFCRTVQPRCVLDIGCNVGLQSAHALANGAGSAIGLESDRDAVDLAFSRADAAGLNFLPLNIDFANPSPSQGWANAERSGLFQRLRADALLALALVHHLCIGRNVPLADAIFALTDLAPRGLIEFVPKQDPQVQKLLRYRPDVRTDYSLENFRAALGARVKILNEAEITPSGRRIFEYAA
jgi:ribosomal protein L11 methylase PrmA